MEIEVRNVGVVTCPDRGPTIPSRWAARLRLERMVKYDDAGRPVSHELHVQIDFIDQATGLRKAFIFLDGQQAVVLGTAILCGGNAASTSVQVIKDAIRHATSVMGAEAKELNARDVKKSEALQDVCLKYDELRKTMKPSEARARMADLLGEILDSTPSHR